MPGGAEAQIGWAAETTVGTPVTVTKFLPFRSENIKNNIEYLDTQTLSSRLTLRKSKAGSKGISGAFMTELCNTTLAVLFKHGFGGYAFSAGTPNTHTFTPGATTTLGLTVQVGRPDSSGTVRPFTYSGMKVATLDISATIEQIATLEVGFVGMSETTATALATASYDATWDPFVFQEASLTVAASARNSVREFTFHADNKIEPRYRLGSATSKNPLGIGVREYTGTITTDFDDLTDYNLFVNGTNAALVATFSNGTQTLVGTMNIQYVGETPEVSGNELLAQTLPYRCLSASSDAAAVTWVLSNSEATA